jgi:polyhydroxyalkanoate synthesis regulator phasin
MEKEKIMSGTLEKFLYASVGLALKGKEKVEEMAKRIIEESKVSEEEGRRFVKEMVDRSEETREEVANMVDEHVKKALKSMGIVTTSDLKKLEARIAALEQKLQSSES